MNIDIRQSETDKRDYLKEITSKFNQRFLAIKAANPNGFMDQFEEQSDSIALEIALELGGTLTFEGDELRFRFGC